MEHEEGEELIISLLGRTIMGVGSDDGEFYLEMDDDRVLWLFVDEEAGLSLAIATNDDIESRQLQ